MPVPLNVQAALFKKILSYDRTLTERGGEPKVIIVDALGDPGLAGKVRSAFGGVGITAEVVSTDRAESALAGASAMFLLASRGQPRLSSLCERHKVISLSGFPVLVESGDVAVALGLESGRPKIIVNLKRLKAEGHQIAAQVLSLARVIR